MDILRIWYNLLQYPLGMTEKHTSRKPQPEEYEFVDVVDTDNQHHYLDKEGNEHGNDTLMLPYTLYYVTDQHKTMIRETHTEEGITREWLGYTSPQMKFGHLSERNYRKELHDFIAQKQKEAEEHYNRTK